MKTTTILRALYVLVFVMLLSTNFSCAGFLNAELDGDIPMKDGFPDFEKIEENAVKEFNKQFYEQYYPQDFIEVSGGLGLDSTEGDSETSFCIGAGYNYRISEDNFNNATFVRGFATHHSQSADERKFNVTRVGAGITYFDRASRNGKLDLTYGLNGSYGFGTSENFGSKDDLTEYRFELDLGINYEISKGLDIGATITTASWAEQTFESGGNEFTQQHTWIGLNKDNMIMAYARIKLD
nr:hypothetical protein [uncultured Psychroserpens sp.]